jgi:type IV pilus assembly protein PilE
MKQQRGFTLVELMATVAIVAILAAIAMPSYREHVNKTRRAEAASALLDASQALERYYSANGTYLATKKTGTTLPANIFPATVPATGSKYYDVAISATPTDNAFALQASRVNAMLGDKCGDFQIDQTGQLTTVGYDASFGSVAEANAYCLRR